MTIAKHTERQYPLVAKVPFTFADFGVSGVAEPAMDLPGNATVIGGELVIETVFDSVTSDTIIVGDGVDDNRYANAVNAKTAARTALTLTGFKYTVPDTIDIQWTGVGTAPSQGSGYLLVEYVLDDRGHEVQPRS